jgi:diguanylate cyclase (GGDEF)-like protein
MIKVHKIMPEEQPQMPLEIEQLHQQVVHLQRDNEHLENLLQQTTKQMTAAKDTILTLAAQLQQEIFKRHQFETALQQARQELETLSTVDNLTQLVNRRRLNEYLQQEWRRLSREKVSLSLILCDIDYFENYHETHGSKAGETSFQQIAQAISRAAKRPSDLVARYGEQEFAAVLPNTDADGAVQVASAMRWEVKLLKLIHAQSPVSSYVTLSVGVSSTLPIHTSSPEVLVKAATEALEEAKQQGRNRVNLKLVDN